MNNPLISLIAAAALAVSTPAIFAGGNATHPYPGGMEADLWVLAGQSNMAGGGLITKEYPANPKIMTFDLTNEWRPAIPPTHNAYTAAARVFKNLAFKYNAALTEAQWNRIVEAQKRKPTGGIGPDLSFAESITRHTSHHVGLIPCARGSTSMADWDPAAKDQGDLSLYGNMIERIRMVGGRVKGVLWYQGEAETRSQATRDGFEKTFLNLVDSIRRDTGIPDLPFIYVQVSRYCLENHDTEIGWETIRDKQRRVAAMRKNLWVVPAIDLPLDDQIHIGAPGQERLGKRMAEVALTYVYNITRHGTPIDFQSYEILPALDPLHNRMRVKFTGVSGSLQAKGRPAGFEFRPEDPNRNGPMVFKVEFDPDDPSSVIVWYSKPINRPVTFYYGPGMNPYVNITDSRDMAIPAFGPITIEPQHRGDTR